MDFNLNQPLLKDAFALYVEELSASFPSKEECASVSFSPRFEHRMERMIQKHQKFYYSWFNTLGKQVASIVILIVLGLTVTTFSVKAWREPVVQFFLELFETFASFSVQTDDPITPEVFNPTEPTYVPDGFTVSTHILAPECSIRYKNEQGQEIVYHQDLLHTYNGGVDNEHSTAHPITINGYEGISSYNTEEGIGTLIFSTEHYVFTVYGTIAYNDLIKMAESIPLE